MSPPTRCFVFGSLLLLSFFAPLTSAKSSLIHLNEDNWDRMLQGEWMVEFFAPWCPACKGLQPVWEDFATWSEDLDVNIAQVDVTASPGLSGRFMVTALPTIYHVHDGVFRQYRGSRGKEDLIGFVEEKKWTELEPVPSWKSPSSYQMSLVSYFFKMSMHLRTLHTMLVEQYGLPTWASYIIFGLATITIGALLGLILVCFIDCVFPPRVLHLPSIKKDKDKKEEDELAEEVEDYGDVIEDDREEEGDVVEEEGYESLQEGDSQSVRKRGRASRDDE